MSESNNHQGGEIHSKLWIAKQWKEKLEQEVKLNQLALEKWSAYIEAVERVRDLENELDLNSGSFINGSGKANTFTDSLIVFAFLKPDYTFAAKDAINWLIEQGLYSNEKGAGDSIYGILANRVDLFERVDRAIYHLTTKAIEFGKKLTQPRSSVVSKIGTNSKHTPLARFILQTLNEREKTLQELKSAAEQKGIDFATKKPGRVLHRALVGMARSHLVEKSNRTWKLSR